MKRSIKLRLDDLEVTTLVMGADKRGGVYGAEATLIPAVCTGNCTGLCETSPDRCQTVEPCQTNEVLIC